jgi:hypothetical protein
MGEWRRIKVGKGTSADKAKRYDVKSLGKGKDKVIVNRETKTIIGKFTHAGSARPNSQEHSVWAVYCDKKQIVSYLPDNSGQIYRPFSSAATSSQPLAENRHPG